MASAAGDVKAGLDNKIIDDFRVFIESTVANCSAYASFDKFEHKPSASQGKQKSPNFLEQMVRLYLSRHIQGGMAVPECVVAECLRRIRGEPQPNLAAAMDAKIAAESAGALEVANSDSALYADALVLAYSPTGAESVLSTLQKLGLRHTADDISAVVKRQNMQCFEVAEEDVNLENGAAAAGSVLNHRFHSGHEWHDTAASADAKDRRDIAGEAAGFLKFPSAALPKARLAPFAEPSGFVFDKVSASTHAGSMYSITFGSRTQVVVTNYDENGGVVYTFKGTQFCKLVVAGELLSQEAVPAKHLTPQQAIRALDPILFSGLAVGAHSSPPTPTSARSRASHGSAVSGSSTIGLSSADSTPLTSDPVASPDYGPVRTASGPAAVGTAASPPMPALNLHIARARAAAGSPPMPTLPVSTLILPDSSANVTATKSSETPNRSLQG